MQFYRAITVQIRTVRPVKAWFKEHEDKIICLILLPHPLNSILLNHGSPFWRREFATDILLHHLNGTFDEEWFNTPLNAIRDFYNAIPRRIQAFIHSKGWPVLY
ncbi:hypothetical protein AVEN_208248-1 [Araneus ventricosus]|uniref:Uncharacterized protein n=1 Tax=Araneus ventricosus TaxID=182803 RepID=A0A4Y2PTR4_ARAVE|nr:hypothetical protein AVEN_208248-1 [Araneus ventricosus]